MTVANAVLLHETGHLIEDQVHGIKRFQLQERLCGKIGEVGLNWASNAQGKMAERQAKGGREEGSVGALLADTLLVTRSLAGHLIARGSYGRALNAYKRSPSERFADSFAEEHASQQFLAGTLVAAPR